MVSLSVSYLFYQPMDEKIKTWTLRFSTKENPNMENELFDWPIVLQYDVKANYRSTSSSLAYFFFHPSKSHPRLYPFDKPLDKQIALLPFEFVHCFCFVRAFSFQGHTKVALTTFFFFSSEL